MELKIKGRSNVWLEILEQSLKQRLGFWTRVVVLKMDFDKSAVKVFMSENQKLLNHLRFRNWNYRRFQVWIFRRKSRSEELCTQEKTFVTNRSFCVMHQKTEKPNTPQKVNNFGLSQHSTWFFSVSTDLVFSMEVSMEPGHFEGCWKINSIPCEEISKVRKVQKVFSVLIYLDTQIQILLKYRFGSSYENIYQKSHSVTCERFSR